MQPNSTAELEVKKSMSEFKFNEELEQDLSVVGVNSIWYDSSDD